MLKVVITHRAFNELKKLISTLIIAAAYGFEPVRIYKFSMTIINSQLRLQLKVSKICFKKKYNISCFVLHDTLLSTCVGPNQWTPRPCVSFISILKSGNKKI